MFFFHSDIYYGFSYYFGSFRIYRNLRNSCNFGISMKIWWLKRLNESIISMENFEQSSLNKIFVFDCGYHFFILTIFRKFETIFGFCGFPFAFFFSDFSNVCHSCFVLNNSVILIFSTLDNCLSKTKAPNSSSNDIDDRSVNYFSQRRKTMKLQLWPHWIYKRSKLSVDFLTS